MLLRFAFTGVLVLVIGLRSENPAELLPGAGACMASLHGSIHAYWVLMLKWLGAEGDDEGRKALESYTDPLRVNHLDVMMMWVAFSLAARMLA